LDFKNEFNSWLNYKKLDNKTLDELNEIKNDSSQIEDRFYKHLEFGTGGLRGVMGAGTNRMNIYTVRRVTQGIAKYLNSQKNKNSVVIAYDSRINSKEFAKEISRVLAGNDIFVYLFDKVKATPELSFAVRYLKSDCGIMITASHNRPIYNGYKVYSDLGIQLSPIVANKVTKVINSLDMFKDIKLADISSNLIKEIGNEIDEEYYLKVLEQRINRNLIREHGKNLVIMYTPLHGVGFEAVNQVMFRSGFSNFHVVESQKVPDGKFPTVDYPNPEDKACFKLAIESAKEIDADLIIANDPDADRIGVAVKNKKNDYEFLTGNQVGILLCNYIITQKKALKVMPNKSFVVSTIVTTRMVSEICRRHNIDYYDTYTGFKHICSKIDELELQKRNFIFGFEESYGYLVGTYARDKDGIVGSILISEMALYYQQKNKNLIEILDELYNEYGFFMEDQLSIVREGVAGSGQIQRIMSDLRNKDTDKFGNYEISVIRDYLEQKSQNVKTGEISKIDMPADNVLYFEMSDKTELAVRPSGTEPKIKFYLFTKSNCKEKSRENLSNLKDEINTNLS